jgi:hypothetical protein
MDAAANHYSYSTTHRNSNTTADGDTNAATNRDAGPTAHPNADTNASAPARRQSESPRRGSV